MRLIDRRLSEKIQIDEGEGLTRMRFMFLMANRKTANGNIYSPDVLKAAAGEFQQHVEKYGPTFGSPGHVKDMELNDVSHMIEDISYDDKKQGLVATIKMLPNAKSKNIQAIIKNGGRVGVSARGEGQKEADGRITKYSIKGCDFTLSPSTGIDVGEKEIIFESAALNEVQVDIAEARYRAALVAGYKGDFESYKKLYAEMLESKKAIGDLHQASLGRVKNPKAADGFPAAYPVPDDKAKDGEEDIAVLEAAFAEALAKQYPNLNLVDWDGEYLLAFDLNRSQHFQIRHGLDEKKGITLGKPEPIDY